MPARVSETFVLRTYPFREADLIVSFLTRDLGKLRGVARRPGERAVYSLVVAAAPDSTTMIGADFASVLVGAMTSYCRVRLPTFIE